MKKSAQSFKDLLVWKKSHILVLEIYNLTKKFPKEELFDLTSQLRRAAISIPANIAEGFGRKGTKDKLRFYNFASSSLNEVIYYIILTNDLQYITDTEIENKANEVGRMLNGYTSSIQTF